MLYINRRRNHLVDMLIPQHFWLRLQVQDGTTTTGNYTVVLDDVAFTTADPGAGTDDSATIVQNLQTQINDSSLHVTAFDGNTANELFIRFDKHGYTPDTYNQNFNYEASTTDGEGAISLTAIRPDSYVIKNAANWDSTFTDIETVPFGIGKRSLKYKPTEALLANSINANQLRNKTRFLFDPSDYSLVDGNVLFFRIAPVVQGLELPVGQIEILLTTAQVLSQHPALFLTGTVPHGPQGAPTAILPFPRKVSSIEIKNTSASDTVYFSFGTGAAEWSLEPGEVFNDNRINETKITMRTDVTGTHPAHVEIYAALNTQTLI